MDTFTRFFQENQERFLSFAYSYIRNKVEAEDILMESMIALWENREKWENDSNLQALLLTIIKNKALNHLAHEQCIVDRQCRFSLQEIGRIYQ